ncbi:MAG: thioredoxin domain-containing protein [bacterium]
MTHKKLHLGILVLILLVVFLLGKEIKKTAGITTKKEIIPIISSGTVDIPIYKTDPIYGNPGAQLTIIEFIDFNCKDCVKIHNQLTDFVDKNQQKARIVWKGVPEPTIFSIPNFLAHQAILCAQKQNKAWQFIKILMQDKKNTTPEGLKNTAQGLNLNTVDWWKCTESIESRYIINTSTNIATELGISYSLPTIFVNNHWVNVNEDIKLEEILKQFVEK